VEIPLFISAMLAAIAWLAAITVPIRPAGTRENLDVRSAEPTDLSSVTALIPARNEAGTIARTLDGLSCQGTDLTVIVVDDQSNDDTGAIVSNWPKSGRFKNLQLIEGSAPPENWVGKVWAQAQGLAQVKTSLVLLIDADIELAPGMLGRLQEQLTNLNLGMVSVMARLRTDSFWERLLTPAYVYFFKLLYPFALVNSPDSRIAAAAGGCVLARSEALERIGGFAALKDAIIDDCTLAGLIKRAGYPIWIGLTHGVTSLRPYESLADIWALVVRSAFAELKFSFVRLLICTAAMILLFFMPIIGPIALSGPTAWLATIALVAMLASYYPILVFYGLSPLRTLTLPVVAAGYLVMTWHSAIRYWRGTRTEWKGRQYRIH
jgi:hopene-associated glycosyltransferase HpnB